MSLSSASATEVYDIDTVQFVHMGDYFAISCSAMIFYECIITLDREISYVWKYRRTATTLLLLSNRCFLMVYALLQLPFTMSDNRSCLVMTTLGNIICTVGDLILAVFSALRIYAISSGKWWYALVILVIGLSAPGVYLYWIITTTDATISKIANVSACSYNIAGNNPNNYNISIGIFTAGMVMSEIAVAIATWMYTSHWRKHIKQPGSSALLLTTLFVDGTIYFLTFVLTSIVIAVITITPSITQDYVTIVLTMLPNILLSRFIYNLRQASTSQGTDTEVDQLDTSQTSIRFDSNLIGNIGEPLTHGSFRDSTTDDDCGDEEEAGHAEAEDPNTGYEQEGVIQIMSTQPV